jgi:phospholipase C
VYYFSDIPFAALLGTHAPPMLPYAPDPQYPSDFLTDAAAGNLPDVAFVDPRFVGEEDGTSNDDHPHADIRAGEVFMNDVYNAVRSSPNWPSTVLVITYDEWGGFFDHVPPGKAADVSPRTRLRGFRVPTVVISPFARRGYVSHRTYDHTSILKMIEWRYHLEPLTPRDKNAHNLATALDFTQSRTAPPYDVPGFTSQGCSAAADTRGAEYHEWPALRDSLLEQGWKLPR